MTAALRRAAATVASAFRTGRTCSTAFSEPLSCRRYSMRKCAPAAEVLLADAADAAPPKVEMIPLVIQRRVVLYDGVCHLCHTGQFFTFFSEKNSEYCALSMLINVLHYALTAYKLTFENFPHFEILGFCTHLVCVWERLVLLFSMCFTLFLLVNVSNISLEKHIGVKWIIKADKERKIRFCCVQSKAAEPYMKVCGVDRDDVLRRFLFVEGPDSYHQGSAGNCFSTATSNN